MSAVIKQAQEKVFVASKQIKQLNTHDTAKGDSGSKLVFNDIVRCVCMPNSNRSKQSLNIINQSDCLLQQYQWILTRVSVSVSNTQAAASTDTQTDTLIAQRVTPLFRLKVKQDPINNKQAYILLVVTQSNDVAKNTACHLHVFNQTKFSVLSFPPLKNNATQLIVDVDSDEFEAITSQQSEIHLS